MEISKCPLLVDSESSRFCAATSRRATPTELQMANYCTTEDHYRCPMILVKVLMGGDRLSRCLPRTVSST